mgnify:CR=1 FL=1
MIELKLPLKHRYGLHARPSQVIATAAMKYESDIVLKWKDEEVDAKSVLGLISLGIPAESTLEFRIDGEDEQQAAQEIEQLVAVNFGLEEPKKTED